MEENNKPKKGEDMKVIKDMFKSKEPSKPSKLSIKVNKLEQSIKEIQSTLKTIKSRLGL